MSGDSVLNITELEERLDGDFPLFIELMELFFEDSKSLLIKINDSISRNDGEALRKSAHTLKGAVSNFSAQRAYDAAYELELAGRNAEFKAAPDKYASLEREIAEVIIAMKDLAEKGNF